jgi:membrane protein required for colicin V production
MNILDMVIIASMIFFIVQSIFRGFFRELGSLAGVIFGIWLGNIYYPHVADYLESHLLSGGYSTFLAFGIIFCLVFGLCSLVGWALSRLFKKVFLGWVDKSFGAVFALLKGVILTYLVIVLIAFFVPSKAPLVAESKVAPFVVASYQSLVSIISPDSYQRWKQQFLGENETADNIVSGRIDDLAERNASQ